MSQMEYFVAVAVPPLQSFVDLSVDQWFLASYLVPLPPTFPLLQLHRYSYVLCRELIDLAILLSDFFFHILSLFVLCLGKLFAVVLPLRRCQG